VESPWRRILCLVEFDDHDYHTVTAASHSALSYATTLAVTHRARVTALHVVPTLPATAAGHEALVQQLADRVRRYVPAHSVRGLIDIYVASGTAKEQLSRSARELGADLIVLGRPDDGAESLARLREMLRDAPCHVLVVHPSRQAAVA